MKKFSKMQLRNLVGNANMSKCLMDLGGRAEEFRENAVFSPL